MTNATRYSQEVVQAYIADRTLGMKKADAMVKYGISHNTADSWWQRHRRMGAARRGMDGMPEPKAIPQIRQHPAARKAYDDFAYFRLIFFGAKTPPWAAKAAEELRDAIESRRKDFVCMNVFPNAGKTFMLQHFVCWLIVRDRSIRIIWGSASTDRATQRTSWIQRELARTEAAEGSAKGIASGRAVKPRYCLAELFGRFRPSAHHRLKWAADEITVAGIRPKTGGEGPPPDGPTLISFGPKSRQIGARADFIVWDDVWTLDENDNVERGKKIKRWFDKTAETRLNENGVLVLVMQRLGPADLSRHVLDKRMPVLDAEGNEVGWESEYRHVIFPAHHDELCTGAHPPGMSPWDPDDPKMGQCLTDPLALPPHDFVRIRGKTVWLVEYQQRDIDPQHATFPEIWLTGGKDETGDVFPGCLDLDRMLWELPKGVPTSTLASAMSVDVGVDNFWGLYASVHSILPEAEDEWILCAEGRRMPAGTELGLLDWDFQRNCFVGIMEEWYQYSKAIGVPFTHVVAETNAAQKLLFRHQNVLDRWQKSRNCRVIGHETKKNKNDPKLGVEFLMAMRFQLGAVRFPWHRGETQNVMRAYYNEIVGYKQGWPTHDILMAAWMRTLNRRRIQRPVAAVPVDGGYADWVPDWMKKMG